MSTLSGRSSLQPLLLKDSFSYQRFRHQETSFTSWNGWSVGDYIIIRQASPLVSDRSYHNYPFLLVDILKIKDVGVRYLVAHIFSEQKASTCIAEDSRPLALGSSLRRRAKDPTRKWLCRKLSGRPKLGAYVLSNYFELECDETRFFTWPQAHLPLLDSGYIFDVNTMLLKSGKILARSSIGQALRSRTEFVYFLRLPHEVSDLVYEFALDSEFEASPTFELETLRYRRGYQQHDRRP